MYYLLQKINEVAEAIFNGFPWFSLTLPHFFFFSTHTAVQVHESAKCSPQTGYRVREESREIGKPLAQLLPFSFATQRYLVKHRAAPTSLQIKHLRSPCPSQCSEGADGAEHPEFTGRLRV